MWLQENSRRPATHTGFYCLDFIQEQIFKPYQNSLCSLPHMLKSRFSQQNLKEPLATKQAMYIKADPQHLSHFYMTMEQNPEQSFVNKWVGLQRPR